jgi:hypothetical protein
MGKSTVYSIKQQDTLSTARNPVFSECAAPAAYILNFPVHILI